MKMKMFTMLLAALAAGTGLAAETFAFHGRLSKADGSEFANPLPLTITFCVYAQASGGEPLWGRMMPVRIERDGTFFVELSDEAGSAVTGTQQMSLKDAFATLSGPAMYLGLTPFGSTEIRPRQEVRRQPRALVAESAVAVDSVKAKTFKADQLAIGGGTVKGAKARIFTQASPVALSADAGLTLTAQSGGTIQVVRSVDGMRTESVSGSWTAPSCESVIWESPGKIRDGSYCSIIYPRGASVKGDGASGTATAFGKVK